MAETIRKENEENKKKVKVQLTAKKNKHQTSNYDISVTAISAELKLRYGDIDFKAYSMILAGFRVNPFKIRVLRSCSENLV